MDLMALVTEGFTPLEAEAVLKQQALNYIRQWLSGPSYSAYRPQLEWLIQQGQWSGLLDRFYQILPFGTGGRRGAVGPGFFARRAL